MEKRAVAVRIAGHEYRILSDGDDEALQEVASYVDEAMHAIGEKTGAVDSLHIAILTALNFGRQLLAFRGLGGANRPPGVSEQRLQDLIDRVESALPPVETAGFEA